MFDGRHCFLEFVGIIELNSFENIVHWKCYNPDKKNSKEYEGDNIKDFIKKAPNLLLEFV